MNVFREQDKLPSLKNAVITTGSFDGVHIGHQKIFARIKELAKYYDGESAVITFDPHPRQVIYPKDQTLRLLTSTSEKIKYFRKFGIDNIVIQPFTIEVSQQHAREYVEKFLIERFNPRCLVVGYDHRFGLNREGDYNLLKEYADQDAFDLVKIDKQDIKDITVSSTKIREAISAGDIEVATGLLGHPYTICGTVVHGQKLGHALGYPTANIKLNSTRKLLPREGIYAVKVHVRGASYGGMLYIGRRPTVNPDARELSIEVNIFDFSDNIYDAPIELELLSFVRGDETLPDLNELQNAIARDEVAVRQILKDMSSASITLSEPFDSTGIKQAEIVDRDANKKCKVAIVALNYNGAGVLPKYLPSFEQHKGEADIYIADNGSTDGSIDFVERQFKAMRIIKLPQNYGYAEGYNKALKNLDYEYLALVNTDIELTADWLDPILRILESNPNIAAVQPKILSAKNRDTFEYAGACGGYIDRLGYPFCAGRVLSEVESDTGQYDRVASIFWASGAAFVIRSDVFFALGGFDRDYFAHMEEIDLCWRIHRAGFDIVYTPESTVYHEGGATLPYNSPQKVFLNFRNNLSTLIKNLPGFDLMIVIPLRILLDLLAGAHFLVKGKFANFWAIGRAYFAVLLWLPSLIRKRHIDRERISAITIGPVNKKGWYRGSIIWQFYLGRKTTFSSLKSKWYAGT